MGRSRVLGAAVMLIAAIASGFYLYVSSLSIGMYFVVDVLGERFTMFVVDHNTVKEALDNLNDLNEMHPIGVLEFGDGGFNKPWGWHYKPDTVRMTDISTEVCDAEPHFVQENLDYFVNVVKYYCPWSARIIAASQSAPSATMQVTPILSTVQGGRLVVGSTVSGSKLAAVRAMCMDLLLIGGARVNHGYGS